MRAQKVTIMEDGKLTIPDGFREELGFKVGDTVTIDVADGALRVWSRAAAIAAAQEFVRSLPPNNSSPVDELLAERREEARRE